MALTQMLVMPLFFLSGALYPLKGLPSVGSRVVTQVRSAHLPSWTRCATRSSATCPSARSPSTPWRPAITWARLAGPLNGSALAMVALMGLTMLTIAIAEFRKTE